MVRQDFRIWAAYTFLCGDNIEKDLKDLDEGKENCEIIFWQPFENESEERILELIENLSNDFEEVYKKGIEDERNRN